MVAPDSALPPADQPAAFTEGVQSRVADWFVARKLSRRTRADFMGVVLRVFTIRVYSAVACLISMLLVAWVAALARAVSARNWQAFKTLDGATLLAAAAQADRYQGYLLPVFLSWAVLLLLTPPGYTIAFRAMAVAAGIMGYLHFSPPSFAVTTRVTAISHWLINFYDRAVIVYLILAIIVSFVLQSSAASAFRNLDYLRKNPPLAPPYRSSAVNLIRRLCRIPLILLVLLSVTWAVTVVRLAASGASGPGTEISRGLQGAVYQSKYLLLLVLLSVFISLITNSERWLIAAVILTTWGGLAPGTLHLPSALDISAGRAQLIHVGTEWGANSLWAALFVFVPVVILGMYFAARLARIR
jgi:hypothetical protein